MHLKNSNTVAKYLVATTIVCICVSFIDKQPLYDNQKLFDVPNVYKKIYGATSISSDGTFITIKSKGLPDHKSIYYVKTDSLFEDFKGTTFNGRQFRKNPNIITEKYYTFKLPLNPQAALTPIPTPLGPIGVALNGVPFFNQYAGPGRQLSNEIESFDQYGGHPAQHGAYHYHVEPLYLTTVKASKSSLLGFLLDGYPAYGSEENGKKVTNEMLDGCHGHTSATADYPHGIYHYHITETDPYINGSGFYGNPGSISR